jgi:hypothetical protein
MGKGVCLAPDPGPADADPTGLSKGLQSRGDVDAIAENVVPLGDHIAQVDPGAELDPFFRRGSRVPLGHLSLHLDRAPDGVHNARELGQEAVSGVLYDPAPVLGYLRINQLVKVRLEPLVRPSSSAPIRREYPATSAARIAVRRRTGGMWLVRRSIGLTNSSLKAASALAFRRPDGITAGVRSYIPPPPPPSPPPCSGTFPVFSGGWGAYRAPAWPVVLPVPAAKHRGFTYFPSQPPHLNSRVFHRFSGEPSRTRSATGPATIPQRRS